jgi:hypothetical protein
MTTTIATEKEIAALRRVERAARRVIRYPDDREPKRSLSRALQNLDKTRRRGE